MVSAAPAQPNSPTEPNNNEPDPEPLILKPSPKPSPSSPGDGLKILFIAKMNNISHNWYIVDISYQNIDY